MGTSGDKLTSTATEVAEALVQTLEPVGVVTSRKMFGGHGVFENGVMFGIVDSKGSVFFRVGEEIEDAYLKAGAARHGKMPYYAVPESVMADSSSVAEWASWSIDLAHRLKKS